MSELKKLSQRVQEILSAHGIVTDIVQFDQSTRTAQEAAQAIGCEVGQIAKSILFKGASTGKPICVIASGAHRVDTHRIQSYVGEALEKAGAEYVLEHTGFVIGGIPPVGHTYELTPLIDEDLLQYKELWAVAGTPHTVFRISPQDLVRLTHGRVVSLKIG